MLKFLSIQNFALIERLEVEFGPGLSLITGETGSGKSILVDAVGLLAGERASQETVRQGFERARIEGIFFLPPHHPARSSLDEAGMDSGGDELILRREISLSGANKVFINGALATRGFLAQLGVLLADIHGQHDQQLLLHARHHLEFLDAFGENRRLLAETSRSFSEWREARRRLEELRTEERDRAGRIEDLRFQLAEIDRLGLRPGLDEELREERRLLANSEKRFQASRGAYELLYEDENGVLSQLDRARRQIESLSALDPRFVTAVSRLDDLRYQLEEIAFQLRDYGQSIEFSPARLEALEERLAEIHKVCRKYAASVEELVEFRQKAARELEELSRREGEIQSLERRESDAARSYEERAGRLSERRREQGQALSRRVEKELVELAMERSTFSVSLRPQPEKPSETGTDEVEFLFSANPGEAPRPLTRIASGGELSRVVLALKSILTVEDYPKTLVFDEVDSGIGGRVASGVGEKLGRLARRHQVFCVTHLPQIACYADHHFHVVKHARGKRTAIEIRRLDGEERVEELARMMAGVSVSDTTRQQARLLLAEARALQATG